MTVAAKNAVMNAVKTAAKTSVKTSAKTASSKPSKTTLDDLVLANKILFHFNVVDAFGHISVRDDRDPRNRYLMSRHLPPGMVTAKDIVTFDMDSNPLTHTDMPQMSERYIHGEIYKARPDVQAVMNIPELRTGWAGEVQARPGSQLRAFALLADSKSICPLNNERTVP